MIVKRVDVWSVARILAAIQACFGLLVGAFVTLLALVGLGAGEEVIPRLVGMAAVFVLPIFYGLMGAVVGALTAVIYNLFAGVLGGVRLEIEPDRSLP
jgi:hypothetical protein